MVDIVSVPNPAPTGELTSSSGSEAANAPASTDPTAGTAPIVGSKIDDSTNLPDGRACCATQNCGDCNKLGLDVSQEFTINLDLLGDPEKSTDMMDRLYTAEATSAVPPVPTIAVVDGAQNVLVAAPTGKFGQAVVSRDAIERLVTPTPAADVDAQASIVRINTTGYSSTTSSPSAGSIPAPVVSIPQASQASQVTQNAPTTQSAQLPQSSVGTATVVSTSAPLRESTANRTDVSSKVQDTARAEGVRVLSQSNNLSHSQATLQSSVSQGQSKGWGQASAMVTPSAVTQVALAIPSARQATTQFGSAPLQSSWSTAPSQPAASLQATTPFVLSRPPQTTVFDSRSAHAYQPARTTPLATENRAVHTIQQSYRVLDQVRRTESQLTRIANSQTVPVRATVATNGFARGSVPYSAANRQGTSVKQVPTNDLAAASIFRLMSVARGATPLMSAERGALNTLRTALSVLNRDSSPVNARIVSQVALNAVRALGTTHQQRIGALAKRLTQERNGVAPRATVVPAGTLTRRESLSLRLQNVRERLSALRGTTRERGERVSGEKSFERKREVGAKQATHRSNKEREQLGRRKGDQKNSRIEKNERRSLRDRDSRIRSKGDPKKTTGERRSDKKLRSDSSSVRKSDLRTARKSERLIRTERVASSVVRERRQNRRDVRELKQEVRSLKAVVTSLLPMLLQIQAGAKASTRLFTEEEVDLKGVTSSRQLQVLLKRHKISGKALERKERELKKRKAQGTSKKAQVMTSSKKKSGAANKESAGSDQDTAPESGDMKTFAKFLSTFQMKSGDSKPAGEA